MANNEILLIEPGYKNKYPPLGLMKIAQYHGPRGKQDRVVFVKGEDKTVLGQAWDRIYITTLFSFEYPRITETIDFALEAAGHCRDKVFVGGIAASLMHERFLAENISIAYKKRTPFVVVVSLTEEVERCLGTIDMTAKQGTIAESDRANLEARIKKLKSKLKSIQERGDTPDALTEFPLEQRTVLNDVFGVIYQSSISFNVADELVGKILAKVRKTKQSSGTNSKRPKR